MKKKFFLFVTVVVFTIGLAGCGEDAHSSDVENEIVEFGERCRQLGTLESVVQVAIDSGDVTPEAESSYFSAREEYEENPSLESLDNLSEIVTDIIDDISETETDLE